jgi:hypothetical protein
MLDRFCDHQANIARVPTTVLPNMQLFRYTTARLIFTNMLALFTFLFLLQGVY